MGMGPWEGGFGVQRPPRIRWWKKSSRIGGYFWNPKINIIISLLPSQAPSGRFQGPLVFQLGLGGADFLPGLGP